MPKRAQDRCRRVLSQPDQCIRALPVVSVSGDAEREVPACVAGADLVPLVAALELLERVFAGGLQQEESSALDVAHEALVDE